MQPDTVPDENSGTTYPSVNIMSNRKAPRSTLYALRSYLMSHISCLISHISYLTSHFSHLTSVYQP
jgi:hypothetical protein